MTQNYEKRLIRVVEHIFDNPGADLSLDALADVAALSRFHFHRVWRAMTGETVAQAVRRVRLHKASWDLASSPTPIAAIAKRAGYPNLVSFNRTFRDAYGMTPAAFRKTGVPRPYIRNQPQEIRVMYPVEIRDLPAQRLATMPHRGSYIEIGRAFESLTAIMATRQLFGHAGPMVGLFYDDPSAVPEADLRSAAGFIMVGDVALDPPIETVMLPAGRHAVLTYTGPYAGLPAAYQQLYAGWLPGSGEEPGDISPFEVYLNSPQEVPQDQVVTEIHLALK